MTSKLVVNTIEADTGISSVSFASSISMSSTSKFHFGDAGIDIGADTNINRPAAGVLGFNINSAEKVRIDSSGRVLIGTTTEGHENADDLTIATSGTGGITIRTGTSNSGSIYFSDATSGTAEYAGFVGYSHANNSMIFGTNGAEKLRIMTNGYFGLGINSPSRRIHVHTSGSGGDYMQFTNDTTGTTNGDGYVFGINGSEDVIHNNLEATNTIFFTSGAERLRITSGGLVGVGQASPTHMLHVDSSNASDSTATALFKGRIIRFDGAASAHSPRLNFSLDGTDKAQILLHRTNVGLDISTLAAEPITFKTNSTERLRIPSAGGIELKTDGKGIQFPTPQTPYHASSNRVGISSEMRYYETGTLTPGLSSTVLNGLQIATFTDGSYARRVNRYVRVGHLVFCTIEIKMASSVTYNAGSTSTTPVCITGTCPFKWAYSGRYDVSGEPDFIPCSISYDSSGLTNDSVYAVLTRNYNAQPRIDITRVGTGGSRQFNSVNFGMVFPANASIAVSYCYPIDLDNADY
jgi:hypothetical protein